MHRIAHAHARARARAFAYTAESLLSSPALALSPADVRVSSSLFLSLFLVASSYPRALPPASPRHPDVVTFPLIFYPARPHPCWTFSVFPLVRPRPTSLPIMLPYCLRLLSLTPKPVQIASSPRARVRAAPSPSSSLSSLSSLLLLPPFCLFFLPPVSPSLFLLLSFSKKTEEQARRTQGD